MLTRPPRLWLCTVAVDMRRSYDGLAALVRHHLGRDPLSGHGFVFVNRRRTQLKCLYFDSDGYCIWSKRLERGQFAIPPRGESAVGGALTHGVRGAGRGAGSCGAQTA